MIEIFRIETDKIYLSWSGPIVSTIYSELETPPPPGHLVISLSRPGAIFEEGTWRNEVPPEIARDPSISIGPRIYEETTYTIYLRSKNKDKVELRHRDPRILKGIIHADDGRVVHGSINFKGQVGRSIFFVFLGGKQELEFEIEIFPSKLDYTTDYEALIADVQDVITSLVLEYLQATFKFGLNIPSQKPSKLVWVTLLRHIIGDLERGLRYIEQHPYRGLVRDWIMTKAHYVHRFDHTIKKAIMCGKGAGPLLKAFNGISIRSKLPERRPIHALDTPEHRWFSIQLERIRRELANIHAEEKLKSRSNKEDEILKEIELFKDRIALLQKIEPIAKASGFPPAGFASLTLQTAPGYREAYRACLILLMGLRVEGGPVRLSIKDISLLYEYWCYLSIVRLIANLTGVHIPVERLIKIEHDTLRVRLKRGYETRIPFTIKNSRRIEVIYNPTFTGDGVVFPQQPDIVLKLHDYDWPAIHLIVDAKYRIDYSAEYKNQFGSPGPPQDAINVLHRYRDAILDISSSEGPRSDRFKRSIVEGVALFPYQDRKDCFQNSRLWISLERIGIGAIPFLPNETRYLEKWIKSVLQRGGWKTAEQSIPHISYQQLRNWREAAKEIVLVGVLRPQNPEQHLEWICREKVYYMPLSKWQKRQFFTRWVAIYTPTSIREPGAVTHIASVLKIEVVKRKDIYTPWLPTRDPDERQVLYWLEEVKILENVIENRGINGHGIRFSQNRWTSRLGLERAKELRQLFLETEPEWRLFEELQIIGMDFNLRPGQPRLRSEEDPIGRAWFVIKDLYVQYRGSAGFLIRHKNRIYKDEYHSSVSSTINRLIELNGSK
jgi:predicted component of viral defense system (DUF524 family)